MYSCKKFEHSNKCALKFYFYRHPSTDFVLHNGPSTTWLLGLKLITIRTSGCTQKPIRNGLCEKCSSFCVINRSTKVVKLLKFLAFTNLLNNIILCSFLDSELNKSNDSSDEVHSDFNEREKLEDVRYVSLIFFFFF